MAQHTEGAGGVTRREALALLAAAASSSALRGGPPPNEPDAIRPVGLSPDRRYLYAATDSGSLSRWDVTTGAAAGAGHPRRDGDERRDIRWRFLLGADCRRVAAVDPAGGVFLGEVGRARPDAVIDARVGAAALSADGSRFAGFVEGVVRVWEARTGAAMAALDDGAEALALSADGALLLAGMGDAVRLWDVASERERCCWRGHGWRAAGLAFSPSGRHALTCGWGGKVRLWEVATGEEALRLEDVRVGEGPVAFVPGAPLAAASASGLAVVWDTRTGRLASPTGLPGEPVGQGVAILYESGRGRCRLLDLRTGQPLPAAPELRLWVRPPRPRSIDD